MILCKWEALPEIMRTVEVRPYWEILNQKRVSLKFKRVFDFATALILLILFGIPMMGIALWIKFDSAGPVFYRQERVTAYGKRFRIHKFRTMVVNADQIGTAVTVDHDGRITRAGQKLRHLRLDELPQLFDVLAGTMSFVGTRPEVPKYVEKYTPEMWATLLLPAGVTSLASICYKDEAKLLNGTEDLDRIYMEEVLPGKMAYNLKELCETGFFYEIRIMFKTAVAVCSKREAMDENAYRAN